jgi:GT2 family glycosyltransferase
LNNDIEVDGNWLKAAIETLLADKQIGAVQSKMMRYDDRKKIDCAGLSVDRFGLCVQIGFGEEDHGQYDNLPEIWGSCGGAMIAWKDVLIKAGLFDRSFFIYYEDVDLCWRIKLSGYKILLSASSLVYHVGSATTQTIPSAFAIFHGTKNYISSWLKNYGLGTLILKFPINISIVIGGLLFEIVYGRFDLFNARFKSTIWVICNLDYILRERYKVQHLIRKKSITDDILFVEDKKRRSSNLSYIVKSQSQKAKNVQKNPFSR